MRKLLVVVAAIIFPVGLVFGADDYPARPIQMIVPFPAGGPADIVGRLCAQHLSAVVGQPVVTLNRDGAGGTIGTAAAARAAPDGYTIVFGTTSTMAVNQVVMKQVPYDFWKEFSLIGLIASAPHILAVRDGLPARTAPELVAMAKQSPGKYTIASSGPGTIVQMAAELFRYETGTDLLVVPFKGGQPATLALLSGDVDMIINDLTTLKSNLAAGKLRALAVAHASRLKPLPDVPTFAELGMRGVVSSTWWGIAVPVKTPEAIQARLRAATARILGDPDYIARLASMAIEPLVMTPEQSSAFVAAEVQKWKTIAAAARIQID
jgi:tripartite-type tricarboxylate transporter receptor subunit TctC